MKLYMYLLVSYSQSVVSMLERLEPDAVLSQNALSQHCGTHVCAALEGTLRAHLHTNTTTNLIPFFLEEEPLPYFLQNI